MVQIQEHEDEETVSHHQSSHPNHHQSTSSEDNHNHNINPHQSSSCHPPPTYSSNYYSSNHIFHGFPAITENPSPPSLPPQSNPNPSSAPSQALVPVNRMVRDQPQAVTKTEPAAETGFSGRRLWLVKGKRGKLMRRVGLVLRCLEFMVCLVSFSVMAADNKRGWALDSFHRYIEFRYLSL
ncbi:CASP-like protein 4A2 [Bienertia sinuspersici]